MTLLPMFPFSHRRHEARIKGWLGVRFFTGFIFLFLWRLNALPVLAAPSMPAATNNEAYTHYLMALIEESRGNFSNALGELDRAIALSPQTATLYKTAAELSFRAGQFDIAVDRVQSALALDPKNVKLLILAGQIYWTVGNTAEAEKTLNEALKLAPDEAEALVSLAVAVTPSDPNRAIKLYEDYLDRHPADNEIHERVAQLYQSLNKLPEAKHAWAKALELSPGSLRAHLASAQIAEVEHDTTTAISHYQAVLDQDPGNLPLILRIGELRYRSNDMAQAQAAFLKALSVAPTSASANFWLALIAESKSDWNEAIRLLNNVTKSNPDPAMMLRLSYYYSQAGQHKEAIRVLESLSLEEPENMDFLNYLSMALEQDQQFAKAIKVVEKMLLIDPENPENYFHLATLFDRVNQFSKAEAALKKTLELKSDHSGALNYLGYSYADRNIKLEEAETLLNQAISIDPQNPAYLDSLGWLHYRQGRFETAENFLLQATSLADDHLIFSHLGDVRLARGRTVDAIRSYDQSLRLKPDDHVLLRKLRRLTSDLSNQEKAVLFVDRTLINFQSLLSIRGFSNVIYCEGKPCVNLKAEFSYQKQDYLRLRVPGMLGEPALMIDKQFGKNIQFGALHPVFKLGEANISQMVERVESLFSFNVVGSTETFLKAASVNTHRSTLIAEAGSLALVFSGADGKLSEIRWLSMGQQEHLFIDWPKKSRFPLVPQRLRWMDKKSNIMLQIDFLSFDITAVKLLSDDEAR